MKSSHRLNRISLGLLGLALTIAGTYGLARGYGAFGTARAQDPVLLDNVRSFVGRNHDWLWPCAFVVALLLSYLGYRLLKAQFVSHPHEQEIRLADGEDRLVIDRSVIADAVAEDLEREPAISHATANLTGSDDAPEIELALTVPDDIALDDLRSHVVAEAMQRARTALDGEPITPHVTLTLTKPGRREVS
jgi:hypothetical protein